MLKRNLIIIVTMTMLLMSVSSYAEQIDVNATMLEENVLKIEYDDWKRFCYTPEDTVDMSYALTERNECMEKLEYCPPKFEQIKSNIKWLAIGAVIMKVILLF